MRFVRPKLLEVLIWLAIIIISIDDHTDFYLRADRNIRIVERLGLKAANTSHPLQLQDVQSIVTNQDWSRYEIALNGASNDWTVAFSTKETKGFGAAVWRMLGIAPKTTSGSLSSSNFMNQAVH